MKLNKDINVSLDSAREKIERALDEVQKRCTARTISYDDIIRSLSFAEKHLGIPKSKMDGVRIYVDVNAQKFPLAYKSAPYSTQFTAVNKRGKWYIVNVCRGICKSPGNAISFIFTDTAISAIIDRISSFGF